MKNFKVALIVGLLCLVVGLVIWQVVDSSVLTVYQKAVAILVMASIFLWVTELIPPFAVSILIIFYLVGTLGGGWLNGDPMPVMQYVNTWSSSIIMLFLGSFVLASGLQRTGLDGTLFKAATSLFGSQPKMVLLGLMVSTAILSGFMSNTSTAAMMIAAVSPLLAKEGKDSSLSKALLIGIASSASIGGMGTIIGSPPNAIAVGALADYGINIDFFQWMKFGMPISLLLVIIFWFVLPMFYPLGSEPIQLESPVMEKRSRRGRVEQAIVFITFGITLILWLTSSFHGIPVAMVAGIPIVILTGSRVCGVKEFRELPWDTLALVAGGLALGQAIVDTKLADHLVAYLEPLAELENPIWMFLGLAYLGVFLSNFMSNTATAALLIPIALAAMPEEMFALGVILGLAVSNAMLLPVSTPPNAIAYSTGKIQQKDFRLSGIFFMLVGPLLVLGWVMLIV